MACSTWHRAPTWTDSWCAPNWSIRANSSALLKAFAEPTCYCIQCALALVAATGVGAGAEEVVGAVYPDQGFVSAGRVLEDRQCVLPRQHFAVTACADVKGGNRDVA